MSVKNASAPAAHYGLEDHLKEYEKRNDSYEHLRGRWISDKAEYTECLKAAILSNPAYSMHDATHSACIVNAIEKILGEENIRRLSPTDTWLLLECAYSHDLGMVVQYDRLVERWLNEEEFDRWIEKDVLNDKALSEQYDFIFPLLAKLRDENENISTDIWMRQERFRYTEQDKTQLYETYKSHEWPIKFRNAVTSLSQAYERRDHPKNSRKTVMDILNRDSNILSRLKELVVDINEFHGGMRADLFRKFKYNIGGVYKDDVHPRFIATMIRIGDLLDLDSNRFNKYIVSVTGIVDRYALIHQLKHKGVKHLDIQPTKISIEAEYSKNETEEYISTLPKFSGQKKYKTEELTIEAAKAMLEWLNWLDEEIKYLKIYNNKIIPRKIKGAVPLFKCKVLHEGTETKSDDIQFVYKSDQRRSAELIEGTDVYKRSGLVFLRELIQNAIDASKRQLFSDISIGQYNNIIRFGEMDEKPEKSFNNEKIPNSTKIDLMEMLKRLDNVIWGYRIEVIVDKARSNEDIEITVRDHGIGVSMDKLRHMRYIGNIFDKDLNEMRPHMPKWLRPTVSFGLGMQSVFRNVRKFELKTARQTDNQKLEGIKVTFYSPRMGGEIYPQLLSKEEAKSFGRGTSVKITLSKDDAEIFLKSANRDDINRFGKYDRFSSALELITQITKDYVAETCTFNGFPIVLLNKNKDESSYVTGDINNELFNLYGSYVITRDETNEPKIIQIKSSVKSEAVNDDSTHIEFSYYDKERALLVKYSFIGNNVYYGEPITNTNKVFFKGIFVDDKWVSRKISLPGDVNSYGVLNISVHIMGEEAKNYLTISRDSFLPESAMKVTEDIQRINLDCLEDIFKIINTASTNVGINNLSNEQEEMNSFYLNIIGNLQFKRLLAEITLYMTDEEIPDVMKESRKDVLNKKLVYIIAGGKEDDKNESPGNISTDTGVLPSESLWYINDEKFISPLSISLVDCSIKNGKRVIAATDLFSNYSDHLAISKLELFIPRWGNGEYEQIYTLSARRANVVEMDEKYFWKYLISLLKIARSVPRRESSRILLPGIRKYQKIAVDSVPNEIKNSENQRFMSWIIVPFPTKKYAEYVNNQNKKIFYDCLNALEGKNLIGWVVKHSLKNRTKSRVTENEIRKSYESWLDDFISAHDNLQ